MNDFLLLPDLAARALGGAVIAANDDFFADRAHLLLPYPVSEHPEFGLRGKVYDGWETRRRRSPGSDHAVIRLGVPGIVHGVVVDTAYFTGNHPPEMSVQGVQLDGHPAPADLDAVGWSEILPRSVALGDTRNTYPVADGGRWTHLRLTIHPDGGVARLRVHGIPRPDPALLAGTIDLAATENGGRVMAASNEFYSAPAQLLLPGPARHMGEGWETARRRDEGNDWVVVALAGLGVPREVEVDTSCFLGNAPGWARVLGSAAAPSVTDPGHGWTELVAHTALLPDTRHRFLLQGAPAISHVRVDIYPDGGFARLRVRGELR